MATIYKFYEENASIIAIPTIAHFVKVTEDKLAGLGIHDTVIMGSNLVVTDFEGFDNGDEDVYNDIYIDTER